MPSVAWDVDESLVARVGAYTGAPAEPGGPKYPPGENPAEGCPAGWRWNALTLALDPYIRMRTTTGDRVINPILDRCDDPLIHALVVAYEREHERCISHRMRIENEHLSKG